MGTATNIIQPQWRPSDQDWDLILRKIISGRCVPFLGAGASLGYGEGPGLPTASQIAKALADDCDYPGADKYDFFRVTQYFRMVLDEDELRTAVTKLLLVKGARPSVVHRTIAQLPVACVLTTNFDELMETAFRENGKQPTMLSYERRAPALTRAIRPTESEPLVYKLHGTLGRKESMVLTEDDVVDFLACMLIGDPPIPNEIKALFEDNSMLFVGYGLKDLNVRVMLRALRGRRDVTPGTSSFAIMRGPSEPSLAREWDQTVIFFGRRESLKCFDMDAEEFVLELKRRFDERGRAHD